MIQLAWLKLVPWRAVAAGAAVVAVIFGLWRVSVWYESHHKALPAAQEALRDEIECKAGL